jgi:hypothetical protein
MAADWEVSRLCRVGEGSSTLATTRTRTRKEAADGGQGEELMAAMSRISLLFEDECLGMSDHLAQFFVTKSC